MDIKMVQEKLKKAWNFIDKENKNAISQIDYILIQNKNGIEKYMIGITCDKEDYIISPQSNKIVINAKNIKYKKRYKELFEERIEGFILTKLNDGYEPVYMTMDTHCRLWEFINIHQEEMDYISNGLYKYFGFCNETGITHKTLEHFYGAKLNDIYWMFVENCFNDYQILLSETIGEKKVILGFQERLYMPDMKTTFVFKVFVIDRESLQIEYVDMHEKIDNAFADYTTHFFGLSFSYYKEKEYENKAKVKEFKEIMQESVW